MKKIVYALITLLLFQIPTVAQSQQKTESELDQWARIVREDSQKLVVGSDGNTTIESIETAFHPKTIASVKEISKTVLSEPGRPYYFKIRAIYKGYDERNKEVYLQDIGKNQTNVKNAASGVFFGINTDVYPVYLVDGLAATLPTEANSIADFYFITARFITEAPDEIVIWIRFVRNIEKPGFDPGKFIVTNTDMRYITVNDFFSPTQDDIEMKARFNWFGAGTLGMFDRRTDLRKIFDPITYSLVNLKDARAAMNKAKPASIGGSEVKYVSEVIFKGQTGRIVTVSSSDNALTEKMDLYGGQSLSIQNGAKIRIYYTVSRSGSDKEIWAIHAIERL